jgi:hypothetical protein
MKFFRLTLVALLFVTSSWANGPVWRSTARDIFGLVNNLSRVAGNSLIRDTYHQYKEIHIERWAAACAEEPPPADLNPRTCEVIKGLLARNLPAADPTWDRIEPFRDFARAVVILTDNRWVELYKDFLEALDNYRKEAMEQAEGSQRNLAELPAPGDGLKHLALMSAFVSYVELGNRRLHRADLEPGQLHALFQEFVDSADDGLVSCIPLEMRKSIFTAKTSIWKSLKDDFFYARPAMVLSLTCGLLIAGGSTYYLSTVKPPMERAIEKFQPFAEDRPAGNHVHNDAGGQRAAEDAAREEANRSFPGLLPNP